MPEQDEHKRGHKFPFVASEVLSCDIRELFELFFKAPCDDVAPEPEPKEEEHSSDSEDLPILDDQKEEEPSEQPQEADSEEAEA